MRPITPAQSAVLAFIGEFIRKRGYPPTKVEIAAGMGYKSRNAAHELVQELAKKNYLKLDHGLARGIRIISK